MYICRYCQGEGQGANLACGNIVLTPATLSIELPPSLAPSLLLYIPHAVVHFGHRSVFPVSLVGHTTRQWWHDMLVLSIYYRPPTDRAVSLMNMYMYQYCIIIPVLLCMHVECSCAEYFLSKVGREKVKY